MEFSPLSPGFVHIKRDKQEFLGIATGIRGGSFTVRKLSTGANLHGVIVRGDQTASWPSSGLTEYNGGVYIYGPYHPGRSLRDAIADQEDEALTALERVARALDVATAVSLAPKKLHTRGVYLLEDGGVLFLPDGLIDAIREQQEESSRFKEFEFLNHPDHSGEKGLSFSLAAMSYSIVTGVQPYDSTDETELHGLIREETVLEPRLCRPALREDVSDLIYSTLRLETIPSFNEWIEAFHDWRDSGLTREISDKERTELEQRAQQKRTALMKQYSRQEKVRKYWKQALVIAAAVILLGTIPGSIIRNRMQPRQTAGMSAEEVVRAFYNAQSELDHQLLEDATVDRAAAGIVREVTNLFVISRMRMGVEFDSGIVAASEWDAAGRPPIPANSWIYGATNVELSDVTSDYSDQASETAELAVFEIRYERWRPDDPPQDPETIDHEQEFSERRTIHVHERVERLHLRRDDEDWVIFLIEELSSSPIEYEIEYEQEREAPAL